MTDKELITAYKSKRDLQAFNELKRRHKPLINSSVGRYASSGVPLPAMEAYALQLFMNAVQSFNPYSGAAFKTHLYNHLKKIDRYVKEQQNIARIPEARAAKIHTYNTSFDRLRLEKGRDPSSDELADELAWNPKEVDRMAKSLRKDLYEGGFESAFEQQKDEEITKLVLEDIYPELNFEEKKVYEYLEGIHGKPKITSGKRIAQLLGMSESKISQVRNSIGNKIRAKIGKIKKFSFARII